MTIGRILFAVVILNVLADLLNDPHPFWSVLVALLVLSYPGSNDVLALRAAHRVLGTAVGIAAYWLWSLLAAPAAWNAALLGALLWTSARLAPRNYGYASAAITVLALMMTQPLVSGISAGDLALNRLLDTVVAALVSALALALIRPHGRREISCGPSDTTMTE